MRHPIILLTISILIFCSCEKEVLEVTHNPVDQLEAATINTERSQTAFEFSVVKQACFNDKVMLSVTIDNPGDYGFLWEINGQPNGH